MQCILLHFDLKWFLPLQMWHVFPQGIRPCSYFSKKLLETLCTLVWYWPKSILFKHFTSPRIILFLNFLHHDILFVFVTVFYIHKVIIDFDHFCPCTVEQNSRLCFLWFFNHTTGCQIYFKLCLPSFEILWHIPFYDVQFAWWSKQGFCHSFVNYRVTK